MQVKKQQLESDMEKQTGFKLGKEYIKGVLSPCILNLYAEYIMWNTRLDEAQAGIKIVRRNISNLRNTDDTTLMAESEEEPKNPLLKVKEESEKVDLKLKIQKTKELEAELAWDREEQLQKQEEEWARCKLEEMECIQKQKNERASWWK